MAVRKPAAPRVRKLAVSAPADLVTKLEAVALARRAAMDAVVSDLLRRSLGPESFAPGAGAEHVAAWKAAFGPLTEDEMLAIDGILVGGDET